MIGDREGETSLSGWSRPRASTPRCRTRDGNKMWNCKLCVERIGPWAVVAVDHAFRGVAGGGMADGDGRTGRMAGNSTRKDRFSLEQSEDLQGFKCAFGWTRRRVEFLVDSRVGNLLGYIGLSLPSEYEKRIPHEAFKGRPRCVGVSCRHPLSPWESDWFVEVEVMVRGEVGRRVGGM